MNTVCIGLELLLSEMKYKMKAIKKTTEDQLENLDNSDLEFWRQVSVDVSENAHIAVSILNDLLDYDKLETGTLRLEIEPVPIWNVVGRAVGQFQITAINKSIELSLKDATTHLSEPTDTDDIEKGDVKTPHRAPTESSSNGSNLSSSSFIALADQVKLGQVLRNVISNALKFTPPNGTIEVMTRHIPDGLPNTKPLHLGEGEPCRHPRAGSIQISIRDSGVGLTSDQLAQLFSEGIQFNANKLQHGGGSGLGLSIAKGFVEQMSGKIWATSDGPGCGTCFTVELPVYEFPLDEVEQILDDMGSTSSPKTGATSSVTSMGNSDYNRSSRKMILSKKRILVAEDVESSRKMLIRLLERAGYDCVPACNGQEALDIIERDLQESANDVNHHAVDVVLIDYEMPIMNGPDATKAIRKLGYGGVVVGVTGNVLEEDVEFFQSKGADRVLPKPVNLKSLQGCWNGDADRSERSRGRPK
jgi:signal transduction histidine kinase/ActR/RegA family two-component response regulator